MLKYVTFSTAMGWVGILGSEKGILRTTLPQFSDTEARKMLLEPADNAIESSGYFANLIERFRLYFSGNETDFPDSLDLSDATTFQRQAWEITRLIPYGETRSYKWIAKKLKNPGAARAVGGTMARNPIPIIIPCHRVLENNGGLGGFSGGLETKIKLLSLEKDKA